MILKSHPPYSQDGGQGKRKSWLSGIQKPLPLIHEIDDDALFELQMSSLNYGPDPLIDEVIEEQLMLRQLLEEVGEFPFLTPSEDIYGPINIGYCMETGAPVGMFPDEVHTLIAGGTGSGKSTLITLIIKQYIDLGIPILVFDYEDDFPDRLSSSDVNVFSVRDFKWNPLEVPEGADPILYAQEWCGIFSDTLGLLTGAKGFLFQQLYGLYDIYGVLNGGRTFPSLFDLNDLLQEKKKRLKTNTREYSYAEVCANRTDFLVKALPYMLDCSRGTPLNVVTRSNTIILLSGIDTEVQTLVVTMMLSWFCRYLIANKLRNRPDLRVGVFLDEGQRLYDKQQERRFQQGIPVISFLTATVRRYNLHLVVGVQQPSLLASSMSANSFTKIQLRLGDGRDIMDLGSSMFLTPEQVYYSKLLETGQAIVKFAGRWPEPLVIEIPYSE